ncbi:protein YgfX [Psychromonas ingrahamii]|uniref:protein YgfX n=1 Tax=Psychromonas ingrahamii TaxID=357794 RepID=UPI00031D6433|nr:protein YgfX [Psychromonas ingrahamii]
MSYSSALKYNISVNTSIYRGVFVFTLYSSLILLLLLVVELTWLSITLSLFLLVIAAYGGKKSYADTYNIKLSDTGKMEVVLANKQLISAEIGASSFYNGFCLFIHLQSRPTDLSNLITQKKRSKKFIVIYKDAVKEDEYRLLARLIKIGQ